MVGGDPDARLGRTSGVPANAARAGRNPRAGVGLSTHIDAVIAVFDALDGPVDRQKLYDLRRYALPVTVIACEFSSSMLAAWIEQGDAHVSELRHILDVEYVDLPTGHWPQFTRPTDLGAAILTAVSRAG